MSEQLQFRTGTASQQAAFTGAQAELTFDSTTSRFFVNDGATAGGFPLALETVKVVSDAAYGALVTDRQIAYSALTAARVVTLPAASAYPAGATLTIVDESGSCSSTNTITATRDGSDVINGSATSAVIASAYGVLQLQSNGSNGWTILNSQFVQATTTIVQGAKGSQTGFGVIESGVVSLSGSSVSLGISVPANAYIVAVSIYIETTIVTSPSGGTWAILDASSSELGGATYSTLAAGSKVVAPIQGFLFYPSASALSFKAESVGTAFTSGSVRAALHYLQITPPTS